MPNPAWPNQNHKMTTEIDTPTTPVEESYLSRRDRHERHQAMLQDHKDRKALARERHLKGWHKFRLCPNTLV
jgi:hypothetical protein